MVEHNFDKVSIFTSMVHDTNINYCFVPKAFCGLFKKWRAKTPAAAVRTVNNERVH